MHKKSKIQTTDIIAISLLVLGLLFIIFLPFLLTRTGGWWAFNASTGVIGDTIGGITAPVSGFLGAFLVYLALKEQIKANKAITEQFREQQESETAIKIISLVTDQLKLFREELDRFEYSFKKEGDGKLLIDINVGMNSEHVLRGTPAVLVLLSTFPISHEDEGSDILYYQYLALHITNLLRTVNYLLDLSIDSPMKKLDSENLVRMIGEIYENRLFRYLSTKEKNRLSNQVQCDQCGKRHGLPDSLYKLYDQINAKLKPYGFPTDI